MFIHDDFGAAYDARKEEVVFLQIRLVCFCRFIQFADCTRTGFFNCLIVFCLTILSVLSMPRYLTLMEFAFKSRKVDLTYYPKATHKFGFQWLT